MCFVIQTTIQMMMIDNAICNNWQWLINKCYTNAMKSIEYCIILHRKQKKMGE